MQIVKKLYGIHSVSYSKIAVITPYRAQQELIREMMDKEGFQENERPSVVTIMESQGTITLAFTFCSIESHMSNVLNVAVRFIGVKLQLSGFAY